MKKIIFICGLFLLFSCNIQIEENSNNRITSFEELEANFKNPSPEYSTAPFWVWNTAVSKEKIDYTLTEFKEQGISGVFIHPRYGLITEYLSDEWWELVSYSLQKAEELDMKLWLYDENSFPSGFAGGHVPAQMPESNSEGVALQPHYLKVLAIPENLERVLHIFKKENGTWKEITGDAAQYKGSSGEFCLLDLNDYETSKWFGGYSYIDLLKPGVTEKFIEVTMPGYEKTLGQEFGKRVPGVFTDEPNTNTRNAGPIRYTPDLYEQFEKQWGYKLQPHLMSLISETGDWKKVRHNYYSTILQLFIDRWSKPWYEYTEEKNLAWTGHYWEHGWPSPKEGPDNMAMYAWHQIPAIDMLFNSESERPDQFGNIRNVKELSSVVNQFGRHRALSETYGAAGWELTFDDLKRLGDWEYVLGVNLMNQHLSYMSLAGDRKHDFPQSFGPYSPYWDLFHYHADYFERLSLALSSGFQKNKILIIEPTTTAWMYYNPTSSEFPEMDVIKDKFEGFLKLLEQYQVEYDLGCENIIKDHGRIENGKFVINQAEYNLVILPPGTENLDETTYELVSEYAEEGGDVYQIDANLQYVGGESQSYDELISSENWNIFNEVNNQIVQKLAENENISFINSGQFGGRVFHQRREFEDGQLLFVTNFDKNEYASVEIEMTGNSVIELDAFNGEITPFHFSNSEDKVQFSLSLPPSGSNLLFVSDKKGKNRKLDNTEKGEQIQTAESVVNRLQKNVLNLDYVELTLGNYQDEPMYFYSAANEIWKAHGYNDNPWVSSSQFKTELVDADTFSVGSGFKVIYPFYIGKNYNNDKMELVVERSQLYTVKVNGEEVERSINKIWLDPDFHVFEIGKQIKNGRNEIELTASPFSIYAELEPVYLLGDFSVVPKESGWILESDSDAKLGSWLNQGMPFYRQSVSYTKEINAPKKGEFLVKLPEWEGTVAEIKVNNEHKGIIQSEPYEISLNLNSGKNEIEIIVYGSLKNTLGPHHNVQRHGIVTPWSFKFAPGNQPSGKEYDLLDYGLMKDFEIYSLNR